MPYLADMLVASCTLVAYALLALAVVRPSVANRWRFIICLPICVGVVLIAGTQSVFAISRIAPSLLGRCNVLTMLLGVAWLCAQSISIWIAFRLFEVRLGATRRIVVAAFPLCATLLFVYCSEMRLCAATIVQNDVDGSKWRSLAPAIDVYWNANGRLASTRRSIDVLRVPLLAHSTLSVNAISDGTITLVADGAAAVCVPLGRGDAGIVGKNPVVMTTIRSKNEFEHYCFGSVDAWEGMSVRLDGDRFHRHLALATPWGAIGFNCGTVIDDHLCVFEANNIICAIDVSTFDLIILGRGSAPLVVQNADERLGIKASNGTREHE